LPRCARPRRALRSFPTRRSSDLGPDGEQTCTHDFSVLPDERLILRVALGSPLGAPDGCATIQTLDEWAAGRGNPEGESYVGLSEDEAIERASEVGARVVGRDGVDLVITMDFRPGRVNLTVFDGTVVAAMVEGWPPPAVRPQRPRPDPGGAPGPAGP